MVLKSGTYAGTVTTVRSGSPSSPITLRAEQSRSAILTASDGKVLRINHAYTTVEGIVVDGQYGPSRSVDVDGAADGLILRDVEVRNSGRDCIDMEDPTNVLVENSLIHHCLNSANGRTDAHGIVAGAIRNLTVRNTEIHSFSGDGIQMDPSRSAPGWDQVTIEGCRVWLEPLPTATNGFPAGTVPGENAVDTKTWSGAPRASLIIRDTAAWGFRNGLIVNQAAFNLKEDIDAIVEGVTVYDSEIAFRLRGPTSRGGAWVQLLNTVIYDVDKAVRYEDDIEILKVFNCTFGDRVDRAFQAASSVSTGVEVRNLLVLGSNLPSEASAPSNLAVSTSSFVGVGSNNYHLAVGSPAIDNGEPLASVTQDRDGVGRPQGSGPDIGAYEWCLQCTPAPPANLQVTSAN